MIFEYTFNLLRFSLTRKGGEVEGQDWNSGVGALSRKRYPRVMFGCHQASMYGFLYFHVFMEPTMPNTMWLMLVGELVIMGVEDGHFCFMVDKRLEGW